MPNWKEYLKFEKCKKILFSGTCWLDSPVKIEIPVECINGMSFYHLHENHEIRFGEDEVDVREMIRCDGFMVTFNHKIKDCIYEDEELMAAHEYHNGEVQEFMEQISEMFKEELEAEKYVNVEEWIANNTGIERMNLIYEDGTKSPDIFLPFDGLELESGCTEYSVFGHESGDYSMLRIVDRECEKSCDFQP